jgi:predicted GIY-YIG superfamily endonuclease
MHLPVKLVYIEEQPDRTSAMLREIQIKTWTHQRKQKLIISQSTPGKENIIAPQEGV